MWALVRAILRQRRKSRISQFSQAEGILAYAEAFQNNLGMHIRCDKEDQVFLRKVIASEYDLNKMKGSLSSRKDELIWELSDSRQSFFTVLGSILSMLAIWVGLDALNEAEDRSRYITEFILKFYKQNPDMVIISVTAVALFYSWITKTRIPLFTNLGNWLFAIIDAAMYDASRFIGDRAALMVESLFLFFLFLFFSVMLAMRLI